MMEGVLLRRKLGLCLSTNQSNNATNTGTGNPFAARCLFGPPDPNKATQLVKEVEQTNAAEFGKRFNFLIENGDGEPYPPAKKMRMGPSATVVAAEQLNDSDEENSGDARIVDEEGYIWTETYYDSYMAQCNKHAISNPRLVAPNRHAVSLLIAPIIPVSNESFQLSRLSPSPSSKIPLMTEESTTSIPPQSTNSTDASPTEPNNNNICDNKNLQNQNSPDCSTPAPVERPHLKRCNRSNSNNSQNTHHHPNHLQNLHHPHHHHQPSAKKTTSSHLSSACHHILTKYTNRILRQTVQLKKPRKSIITDYLHMRRTKNANNNQAAGKK